MKGSEDDPRGLIAEAYRIDGITLPECRSIFLDWALGVSSSQDSLALVRQLIERHSAEPSDHPMTQTLCAALDGSVTARRRGGRAGRGLS